MVSFRAWEPQQYQGYQTLCLSFSSNLFRGEETARRAKEMAGSEPSECQHQRDEEEPNLVQCNPSSPPRFSTPHSCCSSPLCEPQFPRSKGLKIIAESREQEHGDWWAPRARLTLFSLCKWEYRERSREMTCPRPRSRWDNRARLETRVSTSGRTPKLAPRPPTPPGGAGSASPALSGIEAGSP